MVLIVKILFLTRGEKENYETFFSFLHLPIFQFFLPLSSKGFMERKREREKEL